MTVTPSGLTKGEQLAPHTTLELGGLAEYFLRVRERAELLDALRWAHAEQQPVTLLGGGSNVVVSDRGLPGLVLKLETHGVDLDSDSVTAQAGEVWDALVERCVAQGLSGIECLSGIPGSVGAAPIQNIGAYGQELADCAAAIEVLDRETLVSTWLTPRQCGFGYRSSRWKHATGSEIVVAVRLQLSAAQPSPARYPELARALAALPAQPPSLTDIRQCVLGLRRSKSMVLDAHDENRRSVGSFFLNPIVTAAQSDEVAARALAAGVVADANQVPRFAQPDGTLKLSAAWLIERSGTHKGERSGAVGVSSRHCLALVHHGGGSSAQLLALANTLRQRVLAMFGVMLVPEPTLLGFDSKTP
jgi:UDP-N-acetylmuramate dehydrogenase